MLPQSLQSPLHFPQIPPLHYVQLPPVAPKKEKETRTS